MKFSCLERHKKIIFLLLAVIFAAAVCSHLFADPNPRIDFSAGIYTDETWRAYVVKESIIGKQTPAVEFCGNCNYPSMKEPNNPIINFIYFIPMAVFGIKVFGLHLIALALTLIAFLAFIFFIDRNFGFKAGLAFGFLFVFNLLNLEFSKIALVDVILPVFLAMAFIMLVIFLQKGKSASLYASGIFFFIALSIKTTAVFFLAVYAAAFLLQRKKFELKSGLVFLAILIASAAYSIFISPMGSQANNPQILINLVKTPAELFRSMLLVPRNRFFIYNAIAGILSIAAIIGMLKETKLRLKSISMQNTIIILLAVWILGLAGVMALSNYQPARYFMPIAIPVIALAGIVFYRDYSKKISRILHAVFFIAIAVNIFFFLSWAPTYGLADANAGLRDFPEANALCSGWGYAVLFESKNVTCYAGGSRFSQPEKITELGIDYIADDEGNMKDYNGFFNLEKTESFLVGKTKVGVFRITGEKQ
ncbi:MAG: glycosyltransferase family 39 protein [Candidatus ainarchaeum sp.]|nr:glycosyltransferase family 39 protein [Candidatus ainarchaeum sp.]